MERGDSMKKQFIIYCLLLSIVMAGCGRQENDSKDAQISNVETENMKEESAKNGGEKSLVLYFNYSDNVDTTGLDADAISSASLRVGAKDNTENLKLMADEIAEKKNADVFTIKINEVYSADFDEMAPKAREDISNSTSFTFKEMPENLDEYSIIYVGSPIWWYELPQPMKVFIREIDLSGKTVVPFGIHRGSGFSGILDEYKEAWPDATIVEGFTIDADKKNTEVKESFDAFLDKLDY